MFSENKNATQLSKLYVCGLLSELARETPPVSKFRTRALNLLARYPGGTCFMNDASLPIFSRTRVDLPDCIGIKSNLNTDRPKWVRVIVERDFEQSSSTADD